MLQEFIVAFKFLMSNWMCLRMSEKKKLSPKKFAVVIIASAGVIGVAVISNKQSNVIFFTLRHFSSHHNFHISTSISWNIFKCYSSYVIMFVIAEIFSMENSVVFRLGFVLVDRGRVANLGQRQKAQEEEQISHFSNLKMTKNK